MIGVCNDDPNDLLIKVTVIVIVSINGFVCARNDTQGLTIS